MPPRRRSPRPPPCYMCSITQIQSLLFFGAGRINSTGERIEKLGLIHRSPTTAFAVPWWGDSPLPPINGFVSEWLTFRDRLSPELTQWA